MSKGRLTRHERVRRSSERRILLWALASLAGASSVIFALAPREHDKTQVTIYRAPDCVTCPLWERHLQDQGFRTVPGAASDLPRIRSEFRVPAAFRGPQVALVDGLYLEGDVPAPVIRDLLRKREPGKFRGAVAVSRGAAGSAPVEVFLVLESGLMRPLVVHSH